ncbi:MAG: Sua5/YciO/YrdC/YwlC family protein, partial [Elusimicrobiaceae bacterium]|nr:Sua5/YciO/YrdC/YwlC family protein [Elusimicrobiaceae bacterium]
GLRVPAHTVLQALLKQLPMPLACTSANVHTSPVLTRLEDVKTVFAGQVDFILADGTLSPTASTVVDVTSAAPRVLREGQLTQEEIARVYNAANN